MNIFYVDEDPHSAAVALADAHVRKMLVESVQMLAGAYHVPGSYRAPPPKASGVPYKKSHFNHPSSIWARASVANWSWLLGHASALLWEFGHRWPGREHATTSAISYLTAFPPLWLLQAPFTEPPLCMPDEFKSDDAVKSYRAYYRDGKVHLHKWTRRTPPNWLINNGFKIIPGRAA